VPDRRRLLDQFMTRSNVGKSMTCINVTDGHNDEWDVQVSLAVNNNQSSHKTRPLQSALLP
jgi:hypothetical protein